MLKKALLLLLVFLIGISFTTVWAEPTPPNQKEVVLTKVNFFKADLVGVLQQLALESGYNVIITPEVRGTVTLQLVQVTFEEVLDVIMQSQNLIYQREGRNFFIGKPGQFIGDYRSIGYFHIYYAEPKQLAELVKKIFVNEEVLVDERTRTLVVTAPKNVVSRISGMITALDQKMQQITIDVKVIEVSLTALRRLGTEMQLDDTSASLDWGLTSSGSELIVSMIDSGHTWKAIFKSLVKDGKARLLTSPSVSTIDGRESSILIGDKVPIVTKTTDTNDNDTYTVSYLDVGVKLSFTPRVQQNEEIAIDLKTQVSALGEKVGDYYMIGTREVNSNIQAKIGETVFLGGLISQEERDSLMRIPILSRIPLIGRLFRYKERTKDETELIITITPRWNYSINIFSPKLKYETAPPTK